MCRINVKWKDRTDKEKKMLLEAFRQGKTIYTLDKDKRLSDIYSHLFSPDKVYVLKEWVDKLKEGESI